MLKSAAWLMRSLVYKRPGKKALEDRADAVILASIPAAVATDTLTVAGADLRPVNSSAARYKTARVLGHDDRAVMASVGATPTTSSVVMVNRFPQ